MSLIGRLRRLRRTRIPFCLVLALNCSSIVAVLYLCSITCSPDSAGDLKNTGSKCSADAEGAANRQHFLAIIILTRPESRSRRMVIRSTWLKLHSSVYHKFVIGVMDLSRDNEELLREENEQYGDLLLLSNLEEKYESLAQKVLQSFVWIQRNLQVKFVLKVDDDSFVVLSTLYKELQRIANTEDRSPMLYWGFLDGRAKPRHTGKWKEEGFYLCDRFLPYMLGGGYVLGSDLLEFIAQNSNLLRLFNSEDVSVGAWLAGLNVFYVHDQRFDTEHISRGCFNFYLITHKKTDADIRTLHDNLVYGGKLCKTEHRVRLSYEYNWNVPPSLCCLRNRTNV